MIQPIEKIGRGHYKYRVNDWIWNLIYNTSNYADKWELYKGDGLWQLKDRFRTKQAAEAYLEQEQAKAN